MGDGWNQKGFFCLSAASSPTVMMNLLGLAEPLSFPMTWVAAQAHHLPGIPGSHRGQPQGAAWPWGCLLSCLAAINILESIETFVRDILILQEQTFFPKEKMFL